MKIAIAGAGGMGSRFGIMLAQAGNEVILIDQWQEHIDAIRTQGLVADFNGQIITVKLPVYSPHEIVAKGAEADLIVAFTKSAQLKSMFEEIRPIIQTDTKVLCLMNGLGHEDVLKEFVPLKNIYLGVTMWGAFMLGPGRIKLFGDGEVELKNMSPEGKDYALEICRVFSAAGLKAHYSENVRYSVWRKASLNGTLNCLCTIFCCNVMELGRLSVQEHLLKAIIAEFGAVALKEGVNLDQEEVYQLIAGKFDPKGSGMHYPSMYQDLINNHRLTEIDYINGAVWRKGKELGVATPYCELITQLIHGKEELLGAK